MLAVDGTQEASAAVHTDKQSLTDCLQQPVTARITLGRRWWGVTARGQAGASTGGGCKEDGVEGAWSWW